ncbi:MAG TPA: copper-binding protein [Thiobacillaceae bacterium]|nr:copper-binding protein [Thiobacillaceae bacterium]
MKAQSLLFALLLGGIGLPVWAAPQEHAAQDMQNMPMSEGVIRKVDRAAGKITIRHGELYKLGMPAMTMTFRVSDPAMLKRVKPGDSVRFVADRVKGMLTVTHLETKAP